MDNRRANNKLTLNQLKGLKAVIERIAYKMNVFVAKYYKLIQLIEKIDGKDNVPESLKGIGEKIGIIRNNLIGVVSIFFQDMDITIYGLSICAKSCDDLCERYESTLDDLLALYTEKERVMDGMQAQNNQNDIDDKINGNKRVDYKREAMKMLDLFNTFGVTDEETLKNTHGKHINFDEKGKECMNSLTDVIHNISPTAISPEDVTKMKNILDNLGRMDMLDEESKNKQYDTMEEFISELAGRNIRVSRDDGENFSSTETYDKLDAMKILGLFNDDRVTEEDLLKLVPISMDNLDDIAKAYLKSLVEIINNISPSELLVEDALKIKDNVIKLSQMGTMDASRQKQEYKDLDDFMEELSNKRIRNK